MIESVEKSALNSSLLSYWSSENRDRNLFLLNNNIELFNNRIFFVKDDSSFRQIFPLETALYYHLSCFERIRVRLTKPPYNFFSYHLPSRYALSDGILNEVLFYLHKKIQHPHSSKLCTNNCTFQILVNNILPILEVWFDDLKLPINAG